MRKTAKALILSALTVVAVGLSGCSDGMELNGKIFDALGVSAASQAANKKEPQLPQRAGIVLPPDQTRLPEPGVAAPQDATVASLNDPALKKVRAEQERARLHKAYCSGELNWKESAFNREFQAKSPYGPCGAISLDGIVKNN